MGEAAFKDELADRLLTSETPSPFYDPVDPLDRIMAFVAADPLFQKRNDEIEDRFARADESELTTYAEILRRHGREHLLP
jgi:hypothetical protein